MKKEQATDKSETQKILSELKAIKSKRHRERDEVYRKMIARNKACAEAFRPLLDIFLAIKHLVPKDCTVTHSDAEICFEGEYDGAACWYSLYCEWSNDAPTFRIKDDMVHIPEETSYGMAIMKERLMEKLSLVIPDKSCEESNSKK